jgi:hypothetical protein
MGLTPRPVFTGAHVIAGAFGLVFASMGGTLAYAVWFTDHFDDAPFFIKVPFTAVGLFFFTIGALMLINALRGGGIFGAAESITDQAIDQLKARAAQSPEGVRFAPGSYVCPHCGGKLTRAEVSPLGDVKCEFCGAWFNIHKQT